MPKCQQYFHCFIACILVPYSFWVSYQQNTVFILISTAFRSIQKCGIYQRGGAYQKKMLISMWKAKDAALIRGRRLLEENCILLFFLANFKEEEGIKQDGCSILSVCLRRKYFFGLLVFSFTIYILRHLRNDRNILKTARVH